MVFALETYCAASDGRSAARIEEEVIVTPDGAGGDHALPGRRAARHRHDLRARHRHGARQGRRLERRRRRRLCALFCPHQALVLSDEGGRKVGQPHTDQGRQCRYGRPEAGRLPAGRRAHRGRRDRCRRRGSGRHRRRGDRRHGHHRPPGDGRHAPPHVAGALPQHRLRLDARPLLHRPAWDAQRALPPGGHLRRQPDRHARGARRRDHDAARLVAQPQLARRTRTQRSTRSPSRARGSSSRTARGMPIGSRSATWRILQRTSAAFGPSASPPTISS